ncbi:hypothetical protein Y032_0019g3801 [Ancylostoma ceylanicum]|nr:hypothetical protein Y032_0019g3801 [Ancylostoma ceylanicum]
MRSGSETSFPSASDSRDNSMTVTGLREKKLYALIGCLAILTILAIFLLIMNIMLIVSLQMNQHGMKFLRFHNVFNPKVGEMEKVVQFDGNQVDLGTVVTNGNVAGYKDRELYIHGSRVLMSGAENSTRLIIQESGCRLENTEHFQEKMGHDACTMPVNHSCITEHRPSALPRRTVYHINWCDAAEQMDGILRCKDD